MHTDVQRDVNARIAAPSDGRFEHCTDGRYVNYTSNNCLRHSTTSPIVSNRGRPKVVDTEVSSSVGTCRTSRGTQ
jgi:hypothetical protein